MTNIGHFIRTISISAIPILLAIILHEVAHGWTANQLGDPTAKLAKRLTLNPLPHIDLFGTIILPAILLITHSGILFGWAKPVPVNPYNLKDPKKDMMWVAAAGPITNFILAIASAFLLRILNSLNPGLLFFSTQLPGTFNFGSSILQPIALMCIVSIQINIVLGVFNLIPIPPADGGRIMVGILPAKQAETYSKIEPLGLIILFAVILLESRVGILTRVFSFLTRLLIWI